MIESPLECGLYVGGTRVWRECSPAADRWGSGPIAFGTVARALGGGPAVLVGYWCEIPLTGADLPETLDACLAAFVIEDKEPGLGLLHRPDGE